MKNLFINPINLYYYMSNFIKNSNFNCLKLKEIKTIDENTNIIFSISIFPSGNIVSVSNNKSIKIYDINFNSLQVIENAHDDIIYYVSIYDEFNFVTCSKDKNIKIWKGQKVFNELTYFLNESIQNAHNDEINKVIYDSNKKLYSCSEDKTIKIWESYNNKYQLVITLSHSNSIKSLLLLEDKNILLSSGIDGTIFWNINNFEYIINIKDVMCYKNNSIDRIDDDRIIIGGIRLFMKVISISKKKVIKTFKKEFWCYGIYVMEDKNIFLSTAYNYINIYRSDNYQLIQTIQFAHKSSIFGLIGLKDCLILSYGIGEIKIWSF